MAGMEEVEEVTLGYRSSMVGMEEVEEVTLGYRSSMVGRSFIGCWGYNRIEI